MLRRFNIITDETRVPREIEVQDGFYCHAAEVSQQIQEMGRELERRQKLIHTLGNALREFQMDPDA